jgi:hypothetical protein
MQSQCNRLQYNIKRTTEVAVVACLKVDYHRSPLKGRHNTSVRPIGVLVEIQTRWIQYDFRLVQIAHLDAVKKRAAMVEMIMMITITATTLARMEPVPRYVHCTANYYNTKQLEGRKTLWATSFYSVSKTSYRGRHHWKVARFYFQHTLGPKSPNRISRCTHKHSSFLKLPSQRRCTLNEVLNEIHTYFNFWCFKLHHDIYMNCVHEYA